MAKKYKNFSVGDSISKNNDSYTTWTNELLRKLVASKTVIKPNQSTGGHRLIESEVVYTFLSGKGEMEIIEYANHEGGHGTNPSFGIEHKANLSVKTGDFILAEQGVYVKVKNTDDHEQLTYIRIFDSEGARK
jgi:mannose-6-phosphate isomerase-like protein (cupin superfamily)